jgi:hypothetical protein
MPVRLVGHWEDEGWIPTVSEFWLWRFLADDLGVEWWMWPVRDVPGDVCQRDTLEAILGESTGTRVFLEPNRLGAPLDSHIPLPEFTHPDDACYVFGSAHFNPVPGHRRPTDPVVAIPTPHRLGTLWPHQCAAIVAYDRAVKTWR